MKYDFDRVVDRRGTYSIKWEVEPGELPMWVADMDFQTAPQITEAIIKRAQHGVFGYTLIEDEWYDAYQNWWKTRHEWSIEKEWLIFCTGVVPAISSIVRKMTTTAEKVVVMTPVYNIFFNSIINNGRFILESPLHYENGAYEIDFADLEEKLSDPQASLLILCNPHNPIGKIWDRGTLAKIGELCAKHHVLVLSDEIHCDLIRTGLRHTPLGKIMPDYDRLITCMSASKTFNLAGLMHSNIIIRDAEERARFQDRDKNIGAVNPLSIAAHKAAYEHGGPWLEQLKAYVDGNLALVDQFLKENIPGAKFTIPESTYFAWVDLREVLPEVEDLPDFFANKAGVLLEGGDGLFVGNARGHIRLNLAMPRATVQTGLERIAEAIRKEKAGA